MKKILTILATFLSVFSLAQTNSDTIKMINLSDMQIIGRKHSAIEPITQTFFNCDSLSFLNQQKDPFFVIDKATPSIYSQSDNGQGNGYCYMRLRGLDQTRINYNLNGIQLNDNEDQGLYFSNIPGFYNYLSSINVERGIGTSKYGTTSVAGSVDMETRSMSEKTEEINVLMKSTLNDHYADFFYSSGINKEGFAVQVGGSYINNQGYKEHSNDDGGSVFYSVGLFKKKNIFKLFGVSGLTHDQLAFYGVPMDTLNTNYKANLNLTSDKDTFNQNLVCLNWINFSNSKIVFNTSAYFDNVNGTYNTADVLFGVNSYQFGVMSNAVLNINNNTINFGLNINDYERKHFGYDYNGFYIPTGIDTILSKYTNTGHKQDVIGYLKMNYKEGKFNLFCDIQIRDVWFNVYPSKTYNWLFINPKFGVKTIGDKNNVYFNVGITQREPTRTDMVQNIIQNNNFQFGNSDNANFLKYDTTNSLKPEIVTDIELGDNYHIKNIDVNINGYLMFIKNEFVATGVIDPYSGFMIKQSVYLTLRNGIETNIKLKLNKFNLFFNTQLQRNNLFLTNNTSSQKIPFAPDFIGSIGATYTYHKFTVGFTEQSVSSMVMSLDNESYTSTPYMITNSFIDFKHNDITISFKVNNIFNDKYYIPAGIGYNDASYNYHAVPTYYVGQLINYALSVKWKI